MNVLTRTLSLAALFFFVATSLCTAAESSSADQLFGFGQGYFHPTLKVHTEYSDNYKATADNEESDWTTTVSPGFWIAVPASRIPTTVLPSVNNVAGGQGVSRFQDADFKGFQGGLMYNADLVRSHDHSDEDLTKHRAQGLLQYAFAGGLTLEASDVYIQSAEEYADTVSNEQEEYTSNLASLIAYYEFSPKLKFQVGYSNFNLDYESGQGSDFKERTDDQVSVYLFYSILPKTDLFVEYDLIVQDYDQDVLSDREEKRYYVGLKFDSKARITGHIKLGYSEVELDDQDDSFEDFSAYASLGYEFWGNSKVTLTGNHSVKASDQSQYQDVLHSEVGLAYTQMLSYKVGVTLNVAYREDEYRVSDNLSGREDNDRVAGVMLKYAMNEWCTLGAEYRYTDRNSNVDSEEYEENQVMFTVSAMF